MNSGASKGASRAFFRDDEEGRTAIPDEYADELPAVFLLLKSSQRASAEEQHAFAAARITERPAIPKRIFLLNSLPLTGVGKVFKPTLRDEAAKLVISEYLQGESLTMLEIRGYPHREQPLQQGGDYLFHGFGHLARPERSGEPEAADSRFEFSQQLQILGAAWPASLRCWRSVRVSCARST
jgi:hypothetical protein